MIKISIDRQVMQSVMSGVTDQLKSKIDLNHVKKICKKRYGIETINGVEHKGGNMAVFNGQIACKLDFEVRFPMSVLITTKENIDSAPPAKKDIRAEINSIPDVIDDIREEIKDVPTDELDDVLEDFNDISAELDDFTAEELDDIPEELDDIMAQELDDVPQELNDMDKSKKLRLINKDNKKQKKSL
jgi:hypothetical protein